MSDITDRMRTCAAFIMSRPHDAPMPTEHLLDDAAELLVEAAHLIDMMPPPVGEPMEVIPPVVQSAPPTVENKLVGTWIAPGGQLPLEWVRHRSKSACPKCDSRTQKKMYRTIDRTVMLVCPVCAHEWQYHQ